MYLNCCWDVAVNIRYLQSGQKYLVLIKKVPKEKSKKLHWLKYIFCSSHFQMEKKVRCYNAPMVVLHLSDMVELHWVVSRDLKSAILNLKSVFFTIFFFIFSS